MGDIRDSERTRKKILEAAKEEFFEKGFSKARIESIAKKAGIKSQLIYHYFKGKDELIEKILQENEMPQLQKLLYTPVNPVQIMDYRFQIYANDIEYLKFTAWEAIEKNPKKRSRETKRQEYFQIYVEDMRSKQEMGLVPCELDPELLILATTCLTTYPLIFSDVTRMATGMEPDDPEFKKKWSEFLNQISKRIFSVGNE
jgi:AcrR family transcriptional regulator